MVGIASGSRILIANDAEEDRRFLARRLQRLGYAVEQAGNGFEAITLVKGAAPDVVIIDLVMPGLGGLLLLRALRKADPDLPVIVLTERAALDGCVQAMQEGLLFNCLLKPLPDVALLEAAIQRAIEFRRLCRKARQAERIIEMATTNERMVP
ncbi:MAG TPA: response regulator [Patescibacteria group bacterium]|nr:response regulator [Patescibacteria group bacterium]